MPVPGRGERPPPSAPAAGQTTRRPLGLVLLVLAATLPIAFRRRRPVPVLAVTLAATLAGDIA